MLYEMNSKLVISTSRKPTQITRRFAQFLKHYFNAVYINRGKSGFNKIINQAGTYENSLLLIITETKGNPSNIDVYNLKKDNKNPQYSIYISVSLPQESGKINTGKDIVLINKTNKFDEMFEDMTSFKSDERIVKDCVILEDYEEIVSASFIDKKGLNTKYKIYIRGFKSY
ncbi:MAG: hypothetical protein BZ138_04740 [Methanosphaera sp. rholeuAM270]|nr:MAG: hypothetical protein BZ138_04740 [Methanosphaera sp. rholeuAM270]